VRAKESGCTIRRDVVTGATALTFRQDYGGRRRLESGLEFETYGEDVFTIAPDEPLSAVARSDRTDELARGNWRVRVDTWSVVSADAERFHVTNQIQAFEGHVRVFTKSWDRMIPRDLV